jgi:glycosyltransferase involved in cell wall biosynthesis
MAGGKKPLFILPNLNGGGAERATLQLLSKLNARGFDPRLLLIRRSGALLDHVPPELQLRSAIESRASLYSGAPQLVRKLLHLARECDVIVGALEHEACYLAWLTARVTRKPVIGWVHAVMGAHLGEVSRLHTILARQVYPRMDRLVFPSHASAKSLASVTTIDGAKVAVIPSYVDVDELEALSRQPSPELTTEIRSKPIIISIGRLVPSKGFDLLLRAHARLQTSGVDHHLVILGEGPLRSELETLAVRLKMRDSVFMPGFVENPFPLMKVATVFAMPSRFESMALVVLEAMAVGCAIVATDCPGGIREALQLAPDGKHCVEACGLLIRTEDEVALADGLSKLLGDSAARSRLSAAAITHARNFSPENLVPQWERLLTEVA